MPPLFNDNAFETDAMAVMLKHSSSKRLDTDYSTCSSSSNDPSLMFSGNDQVFEYESDIKGRSLHLWFSSEDLQDFRKHNQDTVQTSMSGSLHLYPDMCGRGLEEMTPAGRVQHKNRKKYARSIVLEEQKKQRETNSFEPEKLSEEYSRATIRSRMVAAAKGKGDEIAAHS
jgi:hypothetical protein